MGSCSQSLRRRIGMRRTRQSSSCRAPARAHTIPSCRRGNIHCSTSTPVRPSRKDLLSWHLCGLSLRGSQCARPTPEAPQTNRIMPSARTSHDFRSGRHLGPALDFHVDEPPASVSGARWRWQRRAHRTDAFHDSLRCHPGSATLTWGSLALRRRNAGDRAPLKAQPKEAMKFGQTAGFGGSEGQPRLSQIAYGEGDAGG